MAVPRRRRPAGPLAGAALGAALLGALVAGPLAAASPSPASDASGTSTSPAVSASPAFAGSAAPAARPLVLAYYYIWFQPSSWDRAKRDLPALGPYDSHDPAVIRQHVAWAKQAGIDGFIVSWKHTPTLDAALAALVDEARRQGLKLLLLYQGLDVNRNPIPVAQVRSDLLWFQQTYAGDPVFQPFGRPSAVWSGTWKFKDADIASVRSAVGSPDRLALLGSERDAQQYEARADLLDGDAYYWSSGDPLLTPGYHERLRRLADAIHAHGGIWIAPVAPGFDARLIGGTSVVDRRDGATYREAWGAAAAASPDAVGIISWNEFTENSFIEPSRDLGDTYLRLTAQLIAALRGTAAPSIAPLATVRPTPTASPAAAPAATASRPAGPDALPAVVVGLAILVAVAVLGTALRRRPVA